jgi:hypothetical protein
MTLPKGRPVIAKARPLPYEGNAEQLPLPYPEEVDVTGSNPVRLMR